MVGDTHRYPCQNTVVFHIFNCILYDVIEYKAVARVCIYGLQTLMQTALCFSFPYGKDFLCGVTGKSGCLFHNGIAFFREILLATPFSADIDVFLILTDAERGIVDLR